MNTQESEGKAEYEAQLRRRLDILKKQMENGKLKIAKGLGVVESLRRVRYGSDGSVDLDTVDSRVRALAFAVESMHDREELKQSISLSEIQTAYFSFLDSNFGPLYKTMVRQKATPHQVGKVYSRNKSTMEEMYKDIAVFMETIEAFWAETAEAAHAHVEDMSDSLKGVFGGDLFPTYNENIASKCGVYADTIVLPDPFLRSKHIFELSAPEDQVYYIVKHGLNLLQYKELACADVSPPIVVVLPDTSAIHEQEKEFIYRLGKDDAVIHASKVFGRPFESFEELSDFASSLDTIDRVEAEVADKSRVLFDTEWDGDLRAQIQKATAEFADLLRTDNPGIVVASQALGRMGTSNELLVKSRRLAGTPIIEAHTSWKYFVWKLEYDAEKAGKEYNVQNLHVLRGLQNLAENQMVWLGKVPPDALIELRKADALGEIRSILGKGIDELTQVDPTNFYRTSDQVFDNIRAAFVEHKASIEQLKAKKWKFAGTDIGSWLVVGSLAVTAAATGLPVWGLAAVAADQLLPAPKLKDIPKSIKELAEESNKLKRSPVGMLFKYSQRKA